MNFYLNSFNAFIRKNDFTLVGEIHYMTLIDNILAYFSIVRNDVSCEDESDKVQVNKNTSSLFIKFSAQN